MGIRWAMEERRGRREPAEEWEREEKEDKESRVELMKSRRWTD